MADFDIVVVGAGVAGLSSALSASESCMSMQKSLKILVLERTGPDKTGGNSRWTGSYFRMIDEKTIAPNFIEDMIDFSAGRTDRAYALTFAENIPETIQWVRSKGVKFEYAPSASETTHFFSGLHPVGGGWAIIEALRKSAEAMGDEVSYFSTAWKLALDESGRIDGIWIRGNDGLAAKVSTHAVILACGGFEGNSEMLTQYIGKDSLHLRTLAEGGLSNKGEGIRMALEIGAKGSGQWDSFNGEPIDPRSRKPEALVLNYPAGILVDIMGRRFTDEGASILEDTQQEIARQIFFELPNHRAYMISDRKAKSFVGYDITLATDQPPIEANSIEELARIVGIPIENLVNTVSGFNASVSPGYYDSSKKDGKSTNGISPPKSNWALKIDEPPFICYPIECAIVFTFGGISTNPSAQVLSADDHPIPGLFAAGEITGIYYGKYPGSTSVLRGLVFGRVAGREAVSYVSRKLTETT